MKLPEEERYQKLESLFLNDFLQTPIVGRKYFKTLSKENKAMLLNAIDTEHIRNMFINLDSKNKTIVNEPDPFENTENTRDEKIKTLYQNITRLRKYRKVANLQNYGYFGQLSFLENEELKKILDQIPLDELALVLTHLEKDISGEYIKTLNNNKKKDLMKVLGEHRFASQEKIESLQSKFKEIIKEDIEKNIFINSGRRFFFNQPHYQ